MLRFLVIFGDFTARTVDQIDVHRRNCHNSDTGYASQYDTGLETGLQPDQTWTHWTRQSRCHPDPVAWKSGVTERRQADRGRRVVTAERRRRPRGSTLDCSVITRSSTTTMINKFGQNNQVLSVDYCPRSGWLISNKTPCLFLCFLTAGRPVPSGPIRH